MRNALIICWLAIFYATNVVAGPAVLSYEQRPAVQNTILAERLETLLPVLMRETGIDLWVVIAREYNDDPVFFDTRAQASFHRSENNDAGLSRSGHRRRR